MARKKKSETHRFNESVENAVCSILFDEYTTCKTANIGEVAEFESTVAMLECKRNEKDYDWMSDIFLPELPSIVLTDASGWASQYFQTRDFVDVKLEGNQPTDSKKCKAAKQCINQTLNHKKIYHYQKYIRGRTINSLGGQVYAICWWEQKTVPKIIGYNKRNEELNVDIYGNAMVDRNIQQPAVRVVEEPVYGEDIVYDHFNYEIKDPRDVFTNNKYCYSIQQKDWIAIRSEKTYEDLKKLEKENGYFNLDIVKELKKSQTETETASETYKKGEEDKDISRPVVTKFDNILRFGRFWAVVEEKDEDDYPTKIKPGYDELGEIKENAELISAMIEMIISGNTKVLIRFQPNPFRDSKGNPFYPIVKGICYIHPTKDTGLADGKFLREIQVAINDGFNMGMDREKLATLPTLKGKKWALEDNSTIYFEPQHVMELESPDDLVEFKIDSNVSGMVGLIQMLQSEGQKLTAVYPTTMGQLPSQASTTATAVAGAETRTNIRANYKSLTFEYTFLTEFYWIILQMTYMFAKPETAIKMMGEDAQFFDPDADYTYSPVTSNIETEYNKRTKLQLIDQFIGRLVKIPNPNIWKTLNYLLSMAFDLFDKEFPDYKKYLLEENAPPPEAEGGGQQFGGSTPAMQGEASNQYGQPQMAQEQFARAGWR